MKKLLSILIFACCMAMAFAQNVKPYKVDLSRLPASNEEKTAAFDKKTGMITINKPGKINDDAGIYCWLDNMDVSAYNIIRVKYEALNDIGFILNIDFPDESNAFNWSDKVVYCPSYLKEMVIPITAYPKTFSGLFFQAAWHTSYQQFIIKEISFEKVDNPVLTNIHITDDKPVVDTAPDPTINTKADAWDFVPKIGTGFNYWPLNRVDLSIDFGEDIYQQGYSKTNVKRDMQNIKKKGFKNIRIQVNPGEHFIDDKYTIAPRFISELKYVIDCAIEEDLYVMICGFHWGWEYRTDAEKINKVNPVRYESAIVNKQEQKRSEAVLKAFWTQICAAFNNSYDEHLIFETMNEPGDELHPQVDGHESGIDLNCAVCKSDIKIGNGYNQIIVDTIRASGGNNANRFIMVAAFGWPYSSYFKMPKDKAKNKLIPITHLYPMGVENYETFIYTEGLRKNAIERDFELMDKYFFKKHIPVYVSETGATVKVPMLEKINMIKDLIAETRKPGRSSGVALWFDPIPFGDSHWCYYNENTGEWIQEEFIYSAIYAAEGKEYPLSDAFIKKNEVKIESIVGKELLDAPVEIKNWDAINISKFARAVPSKYKLELVVEKTGPDPKLSLNYIDADKNWSYVIPEKKKIQGATINFFDNDKFYEIIPKGEKIVFSVTEAYSPSIEYLGLYINGKDCLLKSVRVVE